MNIHYDGGHFYVSKGGHSVHSPRFVIREIEYPQYKSILGLLKQYGPKGQLKPTTMERLISGNEGKMVVGPQSYYELSLKLDDFYLIYATLDNLKHVFKTKSALANNGTGIDLNVMGIPPGGLPEPIIEVTEQTDVISATTITSITVSGSGSNMLRFSVGGDMVFRDMNLDWVSEDSRYVGVGTAVAAIETLRTRWLANPKLVNVPVYIGLPH
jgi:hypothetical protein